ncbi:MAG TPA: P-loop NTPase fold protein [Arachnia sp.]|nr:P-loop NTPase fold protein [Arachnia sp.]
MRVRSEKSSEGLELQLLPQGGLASLRSHGALAFGIAKSGQPRLATGGADRTVQIWDPTNGTLLKTLTGYTGGVNSVAFGTTSTGQLLLATGSADGTAQIWDPESGDRRQKLTDHTGGIRAVALGRTSGRQLLLATGSNDGTVRIWDATNGVPLHTFSVRGGWVSSVAFGTTSTGQLLLATGCGDGTVRIWDADTHADLHTIAVGTVGVSSVAFSTTIGATGGGQLFLAAGSSDETVRILEPTTGTTLHAITDHDGGVSSVAFGTTNSGQLLLATASSRMTGVWRVPSSWRRDPIASSDNEFVADRLDRTPLVEHLTGVLDQLADDPAGLAHPTGVLEQLGEKPGGSDHMRGTVVVNIDGRWGSGKSILARLTTTQMASGASSQPTRPRLLRDPVVVWFDAWQQAAIGPRWWTLTAEVKKHIERERAGAAQLLLKTLGGVERLFRSKAVLLAGVVIAAVAALTLPSPPDAKSWETVSKVVGGIATVAVIGVGLGRVLFWASPTIGKLHLTADASPLAEVSDIMARLRRWSPRIGRRHRVADTALAVWALAIIGWVAHWTIQRKDEVVRWPVELPTDSYSLSPLWLPAAIGIVVLMVVSSGPRAKRRSTPAAPEPAAALADKSWPRFASVVARLPDAWHDHRIWSRVAWVVSVLALSVAVGFTIAYVPPIGAWTLPMGAGLIGVGIVIYSGWHWLGRDIARRPIVLVIDDLDRCPADVTVEYLETVHTLMRAGKQPRFLTRWRASAPFVVLVPADGRWVRTAFERHYADFAGLGDQTRRLGADFLQKLFDHTVLVPELTADLTQRFVDHITDSPANDVHGAPRSATSSGGAQRRGPGPHSRSEGDRVHPGPAEPKGQASAAREAASEQVVLDKTRHLLASAPYSSLLPTNPRLIRRVVNAWGMLDALKEQVNHDEAENIVVRAAVLLVRFPSMTDELLGNATPITVKEILANDYTGPWSHPDLRAVLTDDDGTLIEPERLGRCLGRQYRRRRPKVPHELGN